MSNIHQELIGTKEASELIGESVKNTIRRVERNELTPVTKLPGLRGAYLFNRSDVLALAPRTPVAPVSPEATGSAGAFVAPSERRTAMTSTLPNANPPATLGVPAYSGRAPGRESEHSASRTTNERLPG